MPAYASCMQMTIRGVSSEIKKRLASEAKAKGVSLNQAALDTMAKDIGAAGPGQPKRDLSDIVFSMTAEDARVIDAVTKEADAADVAAQREEMRRANRAGHQSLQRPGKRRSGGGRSTLKRG